MMLTDILNDVVKIGEQLVDTTPLVGMGIGIADQKGQQVRAHLGSMDQDPAHKVTDQTIYDLASLTKLYTAKAYVNLHLLQQFDLEQPVCQVLSDFKHPQITFRQLLTHTAGLPSSVRATDHLTKTMILEDIYNCELINQPGTTIRYSDVGYILLGQALSVLMGMPLEKTIEKLVLQPLNLQRTGYRTMQMPGFNSKPSAYFAPTEVNEERGGLLKGAVDDYKAYLLGGAAGHAGLFSSLQDTLQFISSWLEPEVITLLQASRFDFRTLGWHYWRFGGEDNPSIEQEWLYQTGFTGTIMALNLKNKTGLVILTNRVYPNRNIYDQWRVDRYRLPQMFFSR